MDATTTLFNRLNPKVLSADYPQFTFKEDALCRWSPSTQTVYFAPLKQDEDVFSLLHELAHGLLAHTDFNNDLELIRKEVEAWEHAGTVVAPRYEVVIDETIIQEALDSYREWLHRRSACPNCQQNGLQIKTDTYQCINCRCQWRVNDARQCQLKRWKLTA